LTEKDVLIETLEQVIIFSSFFYQNTIWILWYGQVPNNYKVLYMTISENSWLKKMSSSKL
jgi:hypothetical protein